MAILLAFVALYSAVGISVESASTKTNCDFVQPAKSCIQQSCVQSPCTMLCGLTAQYDTCQQSCDSRIGECDALNCVASRTCIQICSRSNCGNITSDAIDCTQTCSTGNCSTMACPHKSTKTCSQLSGKEMTCKANSCTQVCSDNYCQIACPNEGYNCTQTAVTADAAMECDRAVCQQGCTSNKEQCNMKCISSEVAGNCQQACVTSTCRSMTCESSNCTQGCVSGECNVTCPTGVKYCQQVAVQANVTMKCDANVCEQVCTTGNCSMTCSSSVKKCHQVCSSGNCLLQCDSENCMVDCFGKSMCINDSTNNKNNVATKSLHMWFSIFSFFGVAFITYTLG